MRCERCGDTGWVQYTGGSHLVGRTRAEATPEKPVYAKCACGGTRRERMRAVLAAHGRVAVDDINQVLDELEAAIGGTP